MGDFDFGVDKGLFTVCRLCFLAYIAAPARLSFWRPIFLEIQSPTSTILSKSTPVAMPIFSNVYIISSDARLPFAPGLKGHPPTPTNTTVKIL